MKRQGKKSIVKHSANTLSVKAEYIRKVQALVQHYAKSQDFVAQLKAMRAEDAKNE